MTPSIAGMAPASIRAARPLARPSEWRCPSRPNPVTSVIARAPAARAAAPATSLSVVITSTARREQPVVDDAPLAGRHDRADPERLGQDQQVAGTATGVRDHLVGMDEPGHRQPVLRLGVVDRVAADDRDRPPGRRSRPRRGGSPEHLAAEPLEREGDDVHRDDWCPAHRVDVG